MTRWIGLIAWVATTCLCGCRSAQTPDPLQVRNLFNGKNLSGWVNVNTAPDPLSATDGALISTGMPFSIVRTDRQYENFILELEWKHLQAAGNSGVFVWSEGLPPEGKQLPTGVEVQVLELDWAVQNNQTDAYVHGEIFGTGNVKIQPDNPRNVRSKSFENRCLGKGQWNRYTIVCVDGTIKLAVNDKFVNGITKASVKKGYICLESEGAPIHFRNIRIIELPPGITTPEQTAPIVESKETRG